MKSIVGIVVWLLDFLVGNFLNVIILVLEFLGHGFFSRDVVGFNY